MAKPTTNPEQYISIIAHIFRQRWTPNATAFEFERSELIEAAATVGVARPDNLGDVIYTYKFRRPLPSSILETAPEGMSWILEGAGHGRYRFRLVAAGGAVIEPRQDLIAIKIPDSTPEIIGAYALGDEQALLAKVRYNRLIDLFLGLTTYSLQNHLRTHVKGIGQIEIDEIYIGLNRNGAHFVIPVQAKGGSDKLSPVQTVQDIECCQLKFPELICRPVSAQFMDNDVIALFELAMDGGNALVVEERHYRLVPADEIDTATMRKYADRS